MRPIWSRAVLLGVVLLVATPAVADRHEWEARVGVAAEGVFLRWPTVETNPLTLVPAMGFTLHVTYGLSNTWHVGFAARGVWTQGALIGVDAGDGRSSDINFSLWSAGGEALVRYRFNVGRIAPFLEARIGYRYVTYFNSTAVGQTTTSSSLVHPAAHGFTVTFSPGVEFRLTDHLALDLALGFRWDSGGQSPTGITSWTVFLDGLFGVIF